MAKLNGEILGSILSQSGRLLVGPMTNDEFQEYSDTLKTTDGKNIKVMIRRSSLTFNKDFYDTHPNAYRLVIQSEEKQAEIPSFYLIMVVEDEEALVNALKLANIDFVEMVERIQC